MEVLLSKPTVKVSVALGSIARLAEGRTSSRMLEL